MAKDPIKKADNGTYYFRANLGKHPVTGKQIQKYRSNFKTKKEAREAYSKLVLASAEELTEKKETVSFQNFIEEIYLPWYKTQVKDSTYKNRYSTIQKHFAYFYKMDTDKIEPIHVQNWQLKLAKNFSPNYVRIVQGMLCIAFDRAIILGLIDKNPARMIGNVKSKKPKVDFWTLEEFQKVISLLYKGDYYEHYLFISFWLLFMTGMRIGEAAALQWDDIDFETGILSINKSLYYKSMTEYHFTEPKTQAGIRDIVIDEDTIKELKEWKEVQQKVLTNCNFVMSYSGIPTSKHTLPRALEKLAELAGVHRIKIHALRHSHASLLISMGENPLIIKDRLGHEKIQTTLGTYGHLYPNSNFEVAKKLTGKLTYTPATESVADYTSNQFTAQYHKQVN
ncbi:site-specific recombinase, phage integrase family [Marvinbryantia formatexigens DSM 14469]|uniref:Site-specific recombinase, phage integrase family n=1 Tax=Marvinbryantia formatexigens DSM 14469 TaxID=478749 RepID=C6LD53_9FIRM|nr:site-specific integrase [Marvinbryantia formatexigens]EET61287.1 site-specific recombinase, phage integrase family [Marvinbryantia formatexigens DSM 14469]UWO25978.1 site-specific integrase [Marvinbryantia formatexigens DSM 14469]SDF86632.1 AP2-like DNA-binding integrase domain-containing protein [Marvinbryantia formatexigens]